MDATTDNTDSATVQSDRISEAPSLDQDTNKTNGSTTDGTTGKQEEASPEVKDDHKGALKLLGLEMAPLSIPFHRRLETFAVLQWWFCFMFLGFLSTSISLYIFFFTSYYWLTLLLVAWIYYDRRTPFEGGRRSDWVRRWRIWVHMRNYFPVHLHKTADLDPSYNYLMGFHPHGIMSMGAFVNFGTEATGFSQALPGIRPSLLTLTGWFFFPLARDYLMSAGLCDCGKESLDYLLGQAGKGNAVVLVVGGAVESLEAHPHAHRLYLNRRRGFIVKAMEHGAHLVPVYSFGETDIYEQMANPEGSFLRSVQQKLTKWIGFAPPVYRGRGIFNYNLGLLPYRKPIHTVIGKPIPVEKNPNPTSDEIKELHQKYKDALIQLFEDNKLKYGVEADRRLSII
ncbi:2-acylglycerol O-acyltransferase 2-A-like [Diadema antillarum]|uniref:2-acylglycerol O-acyltransferase 2-A-like n=1 Tax=Diadema antillarum TaxID=105358 RepID=UPI003A856857